MVFEHKIVEPEMIWEIFEDLVYNYYYNIGEIQDLLFKEKIQNDSLVIKSNFVGKNKKKIRDKLHHYIKSKNRHSLLYNLVFAIKELPKGEIKQIFLKHLTLFKIDIVRDRYVIVDLSENPQIGISKELAKILFKKIKENYKDKVIIAVNFPMFFHQFFRSIGVYTPSETILMEEGDTYKFYHTYEHLVSSVYYQTENFDKALHTMMKSFISLGKYSVVPLTFELRPSVLNHLKIITDYLKEVRGIRIKNVFYLYNQFPEYRKDIADLIASTRAQIYLSSDTVYLSDLIEIIYYSMINYNWFPKLSESPAIFINDIDLPKVLQRIIILISKVVDVKYLLFYLIHYESDMNVDELRQNSKVYRILLNYLSKQLHLPITDIKILLQNLPIGNNNENMENITEILKKSIVGDDILKVIDKARVRDITEQYKIVHRILNSTFSPSGFLYPVMELEYDMLKTHEVKDIVNKEDTILMELMKIPHSSWYRIAVDKDIEVLEKIIEIAKILYEHPKQYECSALFNFLPFIELEDIRWVIEYLILSKQLPMECKKKIAKALLVNSYISGLFFLRNIKEDDLISELSVLFTNIIPEFVQEFYKLLPDPAITYAPGILISNGIIKIKENDINL